VIVEISVSEAVGVYEANISIEIVMTLKFIPGYVIEIGMTGNNAGISEWVGPC
jgi:hypothetical protein